MYKPSKYHVCDRETISRLINSEYGTRLTAKFFTQKNWGEFQTEATFEEFRDKIIDGFPASTERMELIEFLMSEKIFDIEFGTLSKGRDTLAESYFVISTYLHTFFVIPRGGNATAQFYKDGEYVFSISRYDQIGKVM